MIHRAIAFGIIAFWAVMTALLVRSQFASPSSGQTPVPLEYVFKQMFLHEELSDLGLYRQRQRVGDLHVQPKRRPGEKRSLTATGDAKLETFGFPNKRMILRAVFELDNRDSLDQFAVSASVRGLNAKDPSLGVSVEGRPPEHAYRYAVKEGDAVLKEASGSLEQLLDDPALASLGFDPRAMLRQALTQTTGQLQADAHRTQLTINGDAIAGFVVAIRGGPWLDSRAELTEQGQILAVRGDLGYDLFDDALAP